MFMSSNIEPINDRMYIFQRLTNSISDAGASSLSVLKAGLAYVFSAEIRTIPSSYIASDNCRSVEYMALLPAPFWPKHDVNLATYELSPLLSLNEVVS